MGEHGVQQTEREKKKKKGDQREYQMWTWTEEKATDRLNWVKKEGWTKIELTGRFKGNVSLHRSASGWLNNRSVLVKHCNMTKDTASPTRILHPFIRGHCTNHPRTLYLSTKDTVSFIASAVWWHSISVTRKNRQKSIKDLQKWFY